MSKREEVRGLALSVFQDDRQDIPTRLLAAIELLPHYLPVFDFEATTLARAIAQREDFDAQNSELLERMRSEGMTGDELIDVLKEILGSPGLAEDDRRTALATLQEYTFVNVRRLRF